MLVEPAERGGRRVARGHRHLQEAPGGLGRREGLHDEPVGIVRLGVAGRPAEARVGVDEGAGRELLEPPRVDRVVLPVPVAADDVEVVVEEAVLLEPVEEPVALVLEPHRVRLVVALEGVVPQGLAPGLVGVVGADHRRRRDEDLERGVAREQRLLQPRELRGPPHRLVGSRLGHVRAAVVAPLGQPDLQVARDAVGPVGARVGVVRVDDRHLLEERGPAQLG